MSHLFPRGQCLGTALIVKVDGSLWVTGRNLNGELGTGKKYPYYDSGDFQEGYDLNVPTKIVDSGVVAAAAGEHSLFVKEDGSLWVMGLNTNGQLGDGTITSKLVPTKILDSGAMDVAASGIHSLLLKKDGSVWATGSNYKGELGTGKFGGSSGFF